MSRQLVAICLLTLLSGAPAWGNDLAGGRSHDPNLRQLTAELDGLRDLMQAEFRAIRSTLDERDKLYTERAMLERIAREAALASAKELSMNASIASKEAIAENKKSQDVYNVSHNDLSRKMEAQARELIARTEVDAREKNLEEKIDRLDKDVRLIRDSVGSGISKGEGMSIFWGYFAQIAGLLLSVAAAFGISFIVVNRRTLKR